MDDNGFEYTVIVRSGRNGNFVSANARYPEDSPPPVPDQKIELDELHRKTIRILQGWLSRWGVISRVATQYESLRVPDTFEVLGQYLYQAIFPSAIAEGFDDAKREAEQQRVPLRVVLQFEEDNDQHDGLATFPWEFLYHPRGLGTNGFFIAAETNLTLSRLLAFTDERPLLPKGTLPLRVLFIVSTPESLDRRCARSLQINVGSEQEKEYAKDRAELVAFLAGFQNDVTRLEVRTITSWDYPQISRAVAGETGFNIIHVVGVCRSVSGDIEMALRGEGTFPTWQNAQVLVNLLRRGAQSGRLGLVVLHLCEASRNDYSATFERLAPKLVRAGIPAVLAMQYPVPAKDATEFTQKFYAQLTEGTEIGQAVQEARRSFLDQAGADRVFGTPALYLQSVDGNLVQAATVLDSRRAGSEKSADRPVSDNPAEKLRHVLVVNNLEPDAVQEFSTWIDTIDWTGNPSILRQWILMRRRDDTDLARHGQVYNDMLAIVDNAGAGR